MSNILNKAKDALSGNKHDTTTSHGTASHGTTGAGAYDSTTGGVIGSNAGYQPHQGTLGQKINPLVDSDNDGRNNPASHTGGYGQTQNTHGSGLTNSTTGHTTHGSGLTGGTTGHNIATTGHHTSNAGPHSSNLANKLDPRVDSDRDGRNDPTSRTGGYSQDQGYTGASTLTTGHSATGGPTSGYGSSTYGGSGITGGTAVGGSGYGTQQTSTAGSHSSNLANKLDPRVDSDRDGRNDPTSRTEGYGHDQGYTGASATTSGHSATGGPTGGYGVVTGAVVGTTGTHTTHSGTDHYNQPVHNSALLNKLGI